MTRSIIRTLLFGALLLALAGAAAAQGDSACLNISLAGTWGYYETGTLYLPTGVAVSFGSSGRYTISPDGNLSGARTASVGGTMQKTAVRGSATVNSDCTGAVAIGFYDAAGNLLSTVTKAIVYVNNGEEAYGIITSVVQANGTALQAAITMQAKKLSPARM